jgi:hypothetical protein
MAWGDVFALDASLPKPKPWAQEFSPNHGAAGTRVRIWGQNLLSASVTFKWDAGDHSFQQRPALRLGHRPRRGDYGADHSHHTRGDQHDASDPHGAVIGRHVLVRAFWTD